MPKGTEMASNPYQYRIANDEYVTDFSYLNPTQAGCLFKLRTAYFFSRSPLSSEQVAYLCPAVTEQDQQAREFVLSKFFTFSEGFWHSELMEEKIYLAKQEQEILEAEERAREIRSLKARQSIRARWDKRRIGDSKESGDTNPIGQNIRTYEENHSNVNTNVDSNVSSLPASSNVDTNPIRPNIRTYEENHSNVNTNVDSNVSSLPKSSNVDTNPIRPYIRTYEENHSNVNTNVDSNVSNNSQSKTKSIEAQGISSKNQIPVPEENLQTDPKIFPRSDQIGSDQIRSDTDQIQIRSESVSGSGSVSVSDQQQQIKNLFTRGNLAWQVEEVLQTLIFFGLDAKSLDRWRKRSQENESAVAELAETGMAAFDFDTVSQVFARCQQAKDKEGKPLSSAIAFVIKSLQRELTDIRNRRLAPERTLQKKSKGPRPFNAEECLKELIENPDGTYRAAPKRSSYADRDYTAGLIEQPDGTYRAAPRPRT